jgi:predicted DNA-binding mobile mystery protein A
MKNSAFNLLRLEQTEQALEPYAQLTAQTVPTGGWLRAIRESLGKSLRGQAEVLNISAATLHKSEASEAEGRITLGQLRKLAEGLDCQLVYALVPRKPLKETIENRADYLARREVMGVGHTMSLENQRPTNQFLERQVFDRRNELLAGSWARLWR